MEGPSTIFKFFFLFFLKRARARIPSIRKIAGASKLLKYILK